MPAESHRQRGPGGAVLNRSHASPLGAFPKEFRGSPLQNPDWFFLSVFAACAILLGGATLSLSMRELSGMATSKEIVEIQDRYARLVLDLPARSVKKAKELPPASKDVRKKEEPEEQSPIPELQKAEETRPPQEKVEKKEIEILVAGEIPEIEIKPAGKYDIVKVALQVEPGGQRGLDIVPPADIPDTRAAYSGRYDAKARSGSAAEIADIDIPPAKSYVVRGGSFSEGAPDIDVAPLSAGVGRSAKKYDTAGGGRRPEAVMTGVRELQRPSVITASNVPDTRGESSKRYVMARRGRSSEAPSQEGHPASGNGISSGVAIEDREVSLGRVVNREQVAPDVQTRVSRRYSGRQAESPAKPVSRPPYPEQQAKKDSAATGEGKSQHHLPETSAVHHLEACADPIEETRLKRQLLAYIDGDVFYCADSNGRYAFLNTEMLTTMDVRFVSYRDGEYNRCGALRMALQCLYSKKTKR